MLANGSGLPSAPVRASDVTNIQYTSGTTGSPKGALLTHRNLVNNGRFTGECLGMTERDKMCVPLRLILPSTSFDPLALLEAVQAELTTVTTYNKNPTRRIKDLVKQRTFEIHAVQPICDSRQQNPGSEL